MQIVENVKIWLVKSIKKESSFELPEYCEASLSQGSILTKLSRLHLVPKTDEGITLPLETELELLGNCYPIVCQKKTTEGIVFQNQNKKSRQQLDEDLNFLRLGSTLRSIKKSELDPKYCSPDWYGYGNRKTTLLVYIPGGVLEEAKFQFHHKGERYSVSFRHSHFYPVKKNGLLGSESDSRTSLRRLIFICLGLRQINQSQVFDAMLVQAKSELDKLKPNTRSI